ncbi:hypothetical protein [Cryobacterium sp. Hh38]|uniref:hypothetical protein n=1 Tax=Cryobacterium sp. Hh38 TaxID=1259156 RepID=UPI00141A7671|nr:hypothetical protein [Cryobacterium sp. Hh38]
MPTEDVVPTADVVLMVVATGSTDEVGRVGETGSRRAGGGLDELVRQPASV